MFHTRPVHDSRRPRYSANIFDARRNAGTPTIGTMSGPKSTKMYVIANLTQAVGCSFYLLAESVKKVLRDSVVGRDGKPSNSGVNRTRRRNHPAGNRQPVRNLSPHTHSAKQHEASSRGHQAQRRSEGFQAAAQAIGWSKGRVWVVGAASSIGSGTTNRPNAARQVGSPLLSLSGDASPDRRESPRRLFGQALSRSDSQEEATGGWRWRQSGIGRGQVPSRRFGLPG